MFLHFVYSPMGFAHAMNNASQCCVFYEQYRVCIAKGQGPQCSLYTTHIKMLPFQ
jgi:hypothetical protein